MIAQPLDKMEDGYKGKMNLINYIGKEEDVYKKSLPRVELEKQLDVIHRNRIVHNDIREDNILYDEARGEVYIMDFSLAFFNEKREDIYTLMRIERESLSNLCKTYKWE